MKKKQSITISNNLEICDIPFVEITFIESSGMSVTIHTIGEKHFISKNIGAIHKKLDESFFRVNNSTIVSKSKIKYYLKSDGGLVVMSCNAKIIPSRSRRPGFLKWYKNK